MPKISESTDTFVISPNSFYFPELGNLNMAKHDLLALQASKLSSLKISSVFKQISVTKIQIYKIWKIKGLHV